MKEVVLVLIGAVCSALGGSVVSCVAIWYKAKKARPMRIEERAGEHQFEASKKALRLIRELRMVLVKREHENARQFYRENGPWFSGNGMFLPDEFVEGWKSIALKLGELSLLDQALTERHDENHKSEYIEKAIAIDASLANLAVEAENALRRAMGMKEAA
jgi:hypothetical protein